MSAVNIEELKKRYNFSHISVGKWMDPRASVLPARGGPVSPTRSAESAGAPYLPTYKVSYTRPDLPEPTDDEESEDEGSPGEEQTPEGDEAPPEMRGV